MSAWSPVVALARPYAIGITWLGAVGALELLNENAALRISQRCICVRGRNGLRLRPHEPGSERAGFIATPALGRIQAIETARVRDSDAYGCPCARHLHRREAIGL